MHSLAFDNNWRRFLLLTKQATHDVDKPALYIILDNKKLPCKFSSFCEQFSYDYGFDYDLKGGVLWPSNDSVKESSLVEALNKDFPHVASLISKSPAVIHNLSFLPEEPLSF